MSPVLAGSTFIRPHLNLGYGDDHPHGVRSLPELIDFDAANNPDHIFGIQNRTGNDVSSCEITFSQLQAAVECASAWLVHSGCTTGRTQREQVVSPVAILLGSDIGIFIYMSALLRIGTPVLLLSARLTPVAIAHLLKETSPSCVLISSHVSRSSKEAAEILQSDCATIRPPKFIDALGYEDLLNPKLDLQYITMPSVYTAYERNDLDAIIMHSSGTTGLPKAIYHSQTYALIYAACHRLPEQRNPFRFNVSTLPLYHGFGLLAPMLSLSIGMPFILPPASMIPTGKSTLATLQLSSARYMLSVPSILEDMVRLPGGEGLEALKDLEIVAIGGAAMKDNVGCELAAAGINLLNHWGATELGAIAPIERIPKGYDWRYLMPRSDTGLKIVPLDDGSDSYRLVGHPPGWKEPFEVQDLLVANPHDPRQYKIMGRADDLLVLSTGEKVRPTGLERTLSEHPDVKDALAFGEGQVALGLIIELIAGGAEGDLNDPENRDKLLASIQPYIERGNSLTDKHGKVTNEMIIFTWETTKPLLRTDKGSLARKAIYAAFEAEIKECYEKADMLRALPLPLPDADNCDLLDSLRSLVYEIIGNEDFPDSADFFEVGMDSLQASRLRRSILNGLRVTPYLPTPVHDLEPDFCFENSSVEKLYRAVACLMSRENNCDVVDETREEQRIDAMEQMVEKYRAKLHEYASLAAYARISRRRVRHLGEIKTVVILTGSTGSLGCFLLERLANDATVSKVICLNRPHSTIVTARQRQAHLMETRGASISEAAWDKVVLRDADLTRPDLGLCEDDFSEVLEATHIVHNAWPVNFNRNLSSFEPHIEGLSHLVRVSLLSSGRRPTGSPPTRLLFTSSIAVVGRFPILNTEGPTDVPEDPHDAANTAEFGYPEAKWVCEQVLLSATEFYGNPCSVEEPLIKGSSVRIGQMTGPEGSGAWNESEHVPIIIRTAQRLQALPSLSGSLSWMPVNRAGVVISELLFSKGFRPFYHMENPSRQAWSGLLREIAVILGGKSTPLPLVPLADWLERVRALGDDPASNVAFKILGFLENDFERMAAGSVILRTSTARLDSPTMVTSTAVDRGHMEEYVRYWKSVGAMV